MTMTPHQVLIVAALGGAAGVCVLALLILLGAALYAGIGHLFEAQQQRRTRHQQEAGQQAASDLDTCNNILALPEHDPRDPQ